MPRVVSVRLQEELCDLSHAGSGRGRFLLRENSLDQRRVPHLRDASSCHGPDGRSVSPTFPRLAGQQKDYLVAQLQAFRHKTRADPHAQTCMWGMAVRLSDPTIDAIAAYYASQTPVAEQPSASLETAASKKIFTEGIPSESVPACMAVTARMQEAMA
jgi:cytochrome c553